MYKKLVSAQRKYKKLKGDLENQKKISPENKEFMWLFEVYTAECLDLREKRAKKRMLNGQIQELTQESLAPQQEKMDKV